jgi:EF-P beta-lysylation protein EpmB
MIPRTATILESSTREISIQTERTWQQELADVVREPEELFQLLELPNHLLEQARAACGQFPLRVPRPYLDRIEKGNLDDPLLKQVLPLGEEMIAAPGYSQDPLGEEQTNPVPGLIHKYHGRVLLIVSPACAINCRYCFRRHFSYEDNKPSRNQWQQALDYIASDPSIHEVIYSGGDPLAASDKQLLWLTEQVAAITHVETLRVHTRLPIVIPQRITDQCLHWLTSTRLQPVMVIHCNHPNELDQDVAQSMNRLHLAGVTLLNQSVLLKGINDDADTLKNLSHALFKLKILPYYLHLLDKVQGAKHFEVSEDNARGLIMQLLTKSPGYLVPKLTKEISGALSKTPLVPHL